VSCVLFSGLGQCLVSEGYEGNEIMNADHIKPYDNRCRADVLTWSLLDPTQHCLLIVMCSDNFLLHSILFRGRLSWLCPRNFERETNV
jgi:hypothetical protein